MLSSKTVFEKVCEISGCSDEAIMPFCENAVAVINGKLRTDVDASDIRLLTAAASVAYGDYLIFQNMAESDVGYIKAGDVSIRKNESFAIAYAEKIKKNAFVQIAEFLVDGEFCFRSV